MSYFTCFKKNILLSVLVFLFVLTWNESLIAGHSQTKADFTPPAIPQVNTYGFKEYVRTHHTFPSPYGFEPYRDQYGKPIKFLLNEINHSDPYIPVTFYCNSRLSCPIGVSTNYDKIEFYYLNTNENVSFKIKSRDSILNYFTGLYYPNDPALYKNERINGFYDLGKNVKKGDPLVTVLFSQRALQQISHYSNGKLRGNFSANGADIDLASATGDESLSVGTTLSLIGLGEASGVEFSETVSQTTGETFTTQIQTGFNINISLENQITIGGGPVPASDSFKFGVNTTLSSLLSNGLEIANQRTVSRTYTIKPGINDTYYWAIYQLLYSYRINAPKLETVLYHLQSLWGDTISFKIGDNQVTQDNKLIGNPLPPQRSNLVNDIAVGVAVPMKSDSDRNVFTNVIKFE